MSLQYNSLVNQIRNTINDQVNKNTIDAWKQANRLGIPSDPLEPGHNDAVDAFRHAYTSAKLARDYGDLFANIARQEPG